MFLNLFHCTIEGKIKGFSDSGDIFLKVKNIFSHNNIIWDISNIRGDTELDILQSWEMGSDINFTAKTNSGKIRLLYKDLLPQIAAGIYLINESADGDHIYYGFIQDILKEGGSSYGYSYESRDFESKYNFYIILWKPIGEGEISINLQNEFP